MTIRLLVPKNGLIIPIMGTSNTVSLSDVLFSGVQQKVLRLLFGRPSRSFYFNEIAKLGSIASRASLQRELERMTAVGLITKTEIGKQTHYQANSHAVIFHELRSITLKTFGLADVLRQALSQFASAIRYAFIFGSVAKDTDTATSDIDIMIIAEGLGYSELFEAFTNAEATLGRKVSPTLYSPEEFMKKLQSDNHFVTRVLNQPKIVLLGHEDDIR